MPSATIWSPPATRTTSPATTSPIGTARGTPSRTTVAVGATSAASLSSARFARTSWNVPIAMFANEDAEEERVLGFPKTIVAAPKTARIRLKTVNVFAIAIER